MTSESRHFLSTFLLSFVSRVPLVPPVPPVCKLGSFSGSARYLFLYPVIIVFPHLLLFFFWSQNNPVSELSGLESKPGVFLIISIFSYVLCALKYFFHLPIQATDLSLASNHSVFQYTYWVLFFVQNNHFISRK